MNYYIATTFAAWGVYTLLMINRLPLLHPEMNSEVINYQLCPPRPPKYGVWSELPSGGVYETAFQR